MLRFRVLATLLLVIALAAVGCSNSKTTQDSRAEAGRSGTASAGSSGSATPRQGGDDSAGTASDAAGSGGAAAGSSGTGISAGSATTSTGAGGAAGTAAEVGSGGSSAAGNGGSTADDPSAELFDPDTVPRFDIDLPAASITALNADPDTYVTGTLHYKGETLSNVGIRIKGEATKRDLSHKAAFKIKIDEFVAKSEFHGLRRLTFNNGVQDPTFLAERLAYHMFRAAKLPAPRANSALVYVNGDYYGVYANIESEDKAFLRRWFTSDAGNLYEEGQSDFEYGHELEFDLETNETKNDRSDLTNFFQALLDAQPDTYLRDIGGSLDTGHYLRFSAVEAAVDQWDMYSYTFFYPNNFRIYDDPATGKFVFIPWGMDLSLKPFPYTDRAHISIFELSWYEDNPDHSAPNARVSTGLIFKNCLASPSCKATYTDVIREIAQLFDDTKLDSLAEKYYEQVKPHVYEDTRKELSNEDFEKAYQSLLKTIRTRTAAIDKDLSP